MHAEQRQRTRQLLDERGIASALFAHPHSVTWLTGFAPPVQVGRNLFAAGPALVYYAGGRYTLIVVDAWAELAAPFAAEADCVVLTYKGYTVERELDSSGNLRRVLANLSRAGAVGAGRMGAETVETPSRLPGSSPAAGIMHKSWLPLTAGSRHCASSRRTKNWANYGPTSHLAISAMLPPDAAVVAGASEIEIWMAVETAVQTAAGCRVPIGNDCVVGTRENNIGGWPEDRG